MSPIIEVENLAVEIDTPRGLLKAVRGISFSIDAGQGVGIVGESGSGKSLTLKAVLDLLPTNARVSSGKIVVDGVDTLSLSKVERRKVLSNAIGIVFQDSMTALNPVIPIGDQVAEVPRYRLGMSPQEAKTQALELLEKVGIADGEQRYGLYPHQLSGGLRQRVAIAIALSGNPRVLFCDEPTTALDVTIQAQVLRLIDQLRQKNGTSLVLITHDLAVVNEVCDDIHVMYAGKFVESGKVETTFNTASHPYTYALLKSVPDPDQTVHRLVSISGEPPNLTQPVVGCSFAPRCFAAQEQCLQSEPTLASVSGHAAACFRSSESRSWAL